MSPSSRLGALTIGCLLGSALASAAPPATPASPAAKATPAPRATPAPDPVLEGIVVGPDGKPVAQAVVSARNIQRVPFPFANTTAAITGRTDAAGRFRLVLRDRGAHGLRVEAQGFAPSSLERVLPSAGLRIALGKGAVIEGTVRDGPTGIAVAGAIVEARDDRGRDPGLLSEAGTAAPRATTDAQGKYKLQGLASGLHVVTARARGFGLAERRSVPAGGRADLTLYPSGALAGTVRSADGRPVAGASVAAEGVMRFGPPIARVETTNKEGRFEFVALEPGSYRLVARHKDFASGWAQVIVERQADAEVALTLDPPLTVVGRLVDGSDRPTRGRVVVAEAAGSSVPPSLAATLLAEAGADGRFRISGLPGGSAVLTATAPGFGGKRVEAEMLPARAETDVGAVVLESGLTIRGRVHDKAGQGIAEAWIGARVPRPMGPNPDMPSTVTEADGRFVLGGLEPGRYNLTVHASGFGFAPQDVEAGAENVDIVGQPSGSLTGTVVDENGQPVTSFRVNARPVTQGMPFSGGRIMGSFRMQSVDSAEGRFVVEDLAPAEYTLQVLAPEREPASVSSVAVPAGGTADVGRLKVGPGGMVRGVVVDGTGSGVAGATVRSQGPGMMMMAGTFPETATDASGAFELRGLPGGTARVTASHPAYATDQATVDVEPARGPAEVRLTLSQGGRIEGRARKRDGTPVAGMVSTFSRSGMRGPASNVQAPIGPDGTFVMEHVPAGRITLNLMMGSGSNFAGGLNQEVEVREAETTNVEFVVREILVTGRVTRGGTPAPGMRITVQQQSMAYMSSAGPAAALPAAGPQRLRALTREDGSYELLVDQPGRATFMVEAADGSTRLPPRPVEIPDAEHHTVDLDYAGLVVVSGVVVDGDEQPVPRAHVFARAKEPRPGMSTSSADTGPDGRFQLEVDPGEYEVGARMQGFAHTPEILSVGASGLSDVRLVLSRGGVVKGRVVDASGRPRGGTFVRASVMAGQSSSMGGGMAVTLPDGTFEISGLAEAEHTLLVRTETEQFAFAAGIRPGREGLTLTLRRGGRVQVRILGPDGAPVSGAFATVLSVSSVPVVGLGGGRSDAEGMVEMLTPTGAVQIRANKDNLEGTATVAVGEGAAAPVEVRLAPKAATRRGS